jgi:DnaJ-class molecular chaperone
MAAAKNNQYAKGNKGGGREPFYKSSEEMQDRIDAYFESDKIPSVPGLAYSLGFASKQSLLEYEAKEDFYFPIKRAKLRIETFNAQQLHRKEGSVTGVIFTLKNMGWSDKQDLDVDLNFGQLSEAQIDMIIDKLFKQQENG